MSTLVQSDFSPYGDQPSVLFPANITTNNLLVFGSAMRAAANTWVISTATTNTKNYRLEHLVAQGDATYRRGMATMDVVATAGDGDTYAGDWTVTSAFECIIGLEFSGLDSFTDSDGNDNGTTSDETSLSSVGTVTAGGDTFTAGASFSAATSTNDGLTGELLAYLVSGSTYLLIGLFSIKKGSGFTTPTITWSGDLATPTGQGFQENGAFEVVLAYAYKEVTVASGAGSFVHQHPMLRWRKTGRYRSIK